jgi:hypothetical protein
MIRIMDWGMLGGEVSELRSGRYEVREWDLTRVSEPSFERAATSREL